uniref:DUF397 domain-containing protein n=1 Tax=Candidatus Kentrum eta TaxID=2126337 RepID=A0A450VGK8_9GAMM|nr:MAG: protein of unknown function (DUF397) [Candidatus Kentron sp. H]VFK03936.1 MAG: protein of unknown function (DUF397) [Candidatus Kentron sp. H]VFK06891.1 MAG: protein of unknown function (DUF397) [Candidatus Kentron sp. H]
MTTNKHFKKSSFSFEREMYARCIDVCILSDKVNVRHSKNPSVELEFRLGEWSAFIMGVKNSEFDLVEKI